MNCPKCRGSFSQVLSRQHTLIDLCQGCSGIWLDEGEINFFVDDRKKLARFHAQGLENPEKTALSCPKCTGAMFKGKIPDVGLEIELCPKCKGMFLDKGEIGVLGGPGSGPRASRPPSGPPARGAAVPSGRPPSGPPRPGRAAAAGVARKLVALPPLGTISMVVMGGLYAALFAILVFVAKLGYFDSQLILPIVVGLGILQFLIGPWIMDLSLSWLGSMTWMEVDDLPPHLKAFVIETCKARKIPLPRFGLIADGAPNAFTYGRTPWSARLVITRGILDLLDEKEVRAVVAHELGHIVNWDFVVMTLANMVPVILYHVYRALSRASRGGGKSKAKSSMFAAAMTSYVLYILSRYFVLYLSRVREHWADRFGGESTGDPNALASALVKIAYGLSATQAQESQLEGDEAKSMMNRRLAVQSLGISDAASASVFGLYAAQKPENGPPSVKLTQEVMQWDLWNPWATYYELHSTHPLTAKRIQALGDQAQALGQEPLIRFDLRKPESYWDEFLVDLTVLFAPAIGAAIGALWAYTQGYHGKPFFGPLLIGIGAGALLKTALSYPTSGMLQQPVASLLKKIKVSGVRGIPVRVSGTIIGRGDPGYMFSEDFVLKDATGIIYLDYQQPLAIWNALFALLRSGKFNGEKVEVEGWYRRAPVPYLEIYRIRIAGGGATSTCHAYAFKLISAIALILFGLFILY